MPFRVRMKMKCMHSSEPTQTERERRAVGGKGVKYLKKINAISNAQSDYIARGLQRCEEPDGFFFFLPLKPFIYKNRCIYIQMGTM